MTPSIARSTSRERPSWPIPAGLVAANTVFAAGFGMLLAGITIAMLAVVMIGPDAVWRPVLASIALAGAIVFYDWNHKDNALSPFFMGLCRALAYLTAGYAAASAPEVGLFAAALISLCYLIGLTYIAKQEAHDRSAICGPCSSRRLRSSTALTQITHAPAAVSVVAAALIVWIGQALSDFETPRTGDVPRAVA